MGPQLCSCGNACGSGSATRPGMASMGPQLCSCGNKVLGGRMVRRRDGFNGAATLQLRKPAIASYIEYKYPCFNGAATLQLRKRVIEQHGLFHLMGCFNGAATLQLRKRVTPRATTTARMPLQWGRNFAVAETLVNTNELGKLVELQWGRNFAVAETSGHGSHVLRAWRASMGPQLCSCGNVGVIAMSNATTMLQWGRNFAVAETRLPRNNTPICRPGFNGAATLQLRKRELPIDFAMIRNASMGPQLCSCGNY